MSPSGNATSMRSQELTSGASRSGVDQPCPGADRQVAGLDMQGGPHPRRVDDLDVGGRHPPPVLVVDGNLGPGTIGHR